MSLQTLNENNWKILNAINHPVRKEILKHLRENKTLSFNELSKCITIGNHGRLVFT
ncbi:helix-turn-helix domain-containing protein [Candidatus Bathyarchaeota archaeon]|nr:helix-turn-helix domain-containing protein [Candidatus Bathyarchaeota archaeon]